jgi:hypothetical protein
VFARPVDPAGDVLRDSLILGGAAAALAVPGVAVAGAASAAVLGLPLPFGCPNRPCVSVPPEATHDVVGTHVHRARTEPWQLADHCDLPVLGAARTCLDLTREFGLAAGLAAADSAHRQRLLTRGDLMKTDASISGRARSRDNARVIEMVDGRRESPLESLSAIGLAELPWAPALQATIHLPDGRRVRRVDFYWKHLGVVGEADGRAKYTDQQLWEEKQKEDLLSEMGLVSVRWGFREALLVRPMLDRVQRAFYRAEMLRSSGVFPTAIVRFAPPLAGF